MRALVAAAFVAAASPAFAVDLFTVDITSGSESAHLGFSNVEEAFAAVETANLRNTITYSGTEPASIAINFRGLPMSLSYPAAGSTQLILSIPSLGINQVFTGNGSDVPSARDDAQDQLVDYFKGEGGDLVGKIMRELARVSPVDPIAGNPTSLQSRMVASDFDTGFSSVASNLATPPGGMSNPNLIGIGLNYGAFKTDDIKSQMVTLPISYTIRSNNDAGHQFNIRIPVTFVEAEGATTYQAGLGLTYRVPITRGWALAPGINYAVTGSRELGSVAQIASGSLTSSYELPVGGTVIGMGNMIGYYETLKFSVGEYSFDPGITNTVYRNGLMWSVPLGGRIAAEFSYINTQFTGTELYINAYNEFGITLGTARGVEGVLSFIRVGATYLYSEKSKGFTLNAGYWF